MTQPTTPPDQQGSSQPKVSPCSSSRQDEQYRRILSIADIGIASQGITHHLNNLLGVAAGHLGLATRESGSAEQTQRSLQLVDQSLQQIVATIRNLGLIQLAGQEHRALHSPDHLIQSAIDRLHQEFPSADVTVRHHDKPVQLLTDALLLETTIYHLLRNAAQACSSCANGQKITLQSSVVVNEYASNWALTITDEGIGIPKELLTSAFDPFVTTKEGQGKGLGLTIARQCMYMLSANVTLQSDPGSGTAVTLTHPLHVPVLSEDTHSRQTN